MTYPGQPDPYGQPQPYSPGPYPPHPAYQPPMVMAVAPPTSGWAAASLVFGILGIFGGWCLVGIPCLLAVIAGHIGLSATRTGTRGGRGMAVAGLILGYVVVVPSVLVFFVFGGLGAIGSVTPSPSGAP